MSIREKFKDSKTRFKERASRIFGGRPSSVPPTESAPNIQTSTSSNIPAPSSLAVPVVIEPVPQRNSAPPTSAQPTESNEPAPSTSVPRATSPLPQAAIADSSPSGRPASAPPMDRSPEANTTWSGQKAFQGFFHSGVFGQLQPVIDLVTELFEAYKDDAAADSDYAALQSDLESLLKTLNTSFPSDIPMNVAEHIEDLCSSISKELDQISSRENGGTSRRFMQANKDLDKVVECHRRIRGHVDTVTLKIVGGHGKILGKHTKLLDEHTRLAGEQARVTEAQANSLVEHEKRLDEQARLGEEQARLVEEQARSAREREKLAKEEAIENRLKTLNPSLAACYKSSEAETLLRRECTPNTRKEVLSRLDQWRYDANQGNIFWMNGMAGTGKTTIANTLCATLKTEQKLGASFFCTRQLPECRSVKLILPTIAYQLARFSRPFRDALSQALESDPDLSTKDLPTQLEGLIIGPLRQISAPGPTDLVIVIDALDECEDRGGVGQILELLVNHAFELPVKVFVSSRPEEQIRRNVGSAQSQLVLHELNNKIVSGDIEIYLRVELAGTSVSESQLSQLVERAGVLFIYAATAIRYIKAKKFHSGQQERVKIVLDASSSPSSNKNKDIDALYSAVLASAFNASDLDVADINMMRLVLHTVVCAQEPLSADALAGLLQLENGELVLEALVPLWSVLHVSGSAGASLVTTLHASFPDYMFDAQRSYEHCCDATSHHGQLANLCFERVEGNDKQFNICGLESSYLPDDQVPDLGERVKLAIPLDLLYACQYWAVHLELGGKSNDRIQVLENFLSKRLLLWMEVLNLKKRMNVGAVLLEKARKWCTSQGGSEAIQSLIHDAWRFVTTFTANPVSRCTPHLYVSMLPFWPDDSKLIKECYVKRAEGLAEVGGSGMTRRQLALLGVFPVGSYVSSVAVSPDGMCIICGCGDGTIRVWDAQSGKMILEPLRGDTGQVFSVACSPDGHRIASGSWDCTIRVWDAQSGKAVLEPLRGHSWAVPSVAFSPESALIVSGSWDKTIRVWDAQTGRMVLGPLEGHTDYVSSVAFSPDGRRIASGSQDKTIRVWNSQSGQLVLGPLEGDTGSVNSVAFSPDSTHIVSGSGDKTIRVWDAHSGETILGPLEGCTAAVSAVAYSPDGVHIVSGSEDRAVRVWDTRSGQVVLGPLEGHTHWVSSVVFLPDGLRIVSGSYDATIRVWDAQSRETSPGPFDGHTESVNSVTFAPDGMCIASGSADRTIRVWDVRSGKMLLGPLEGHTGEVKSVAFSLDSKCIVSGSNDETIRVWDSQSGKMVLGPLTDHSYSVHSVAFSPDGTHIVSGCSGDRIQVWDAQSGNLVLALKGHAASIFSVHTVCSVVLSPDGRRIVSGSDDKTIRVWDAENGKQVLEPFQGHTDPVRSVALSPDGARIVSGSDDQTICVWNAETGKMVMRPLKGHNKGVSSVAFSPDGIYIVSGSWDKTIRVWAAQTGELVIGPLHGHILPILSISFSPDSTHFVSSSDDKAIRVWCLPIRPSADNPVHSPATPSLSHAAADSLTPHSSFPLKASSVMHLPWTMDEDGWVVDENQHLWLWVPSDLRASIVWPNHTLVISPRGSVRLSFDGANMGESWADCYISA